MGCVSSSTAKKSEQKPRPPQPDLNDLYDQPDPYAAEPVKKYAAAQPVVVENGHAHRQSNGAATTYAPQPPRHSTPPPIEPAYGSGHETQHEQEANHLHKDPIHQESQSCTQVIRTYGESVLSQSPGPKYRVVKTLGKGGFGVVSLCERTAPDVTQRMPQKFALKELISPKVYPLGKTENIRDYLPLNEAAIQRYMRHSSIVETYWADVRCLHPDTGEVLDVGAGELDGKWTPIDHLNDIEKTYEAAERKQQPLPYKEVKLQMRIAMEHCDLGSVKDYLVDSPEKQGTRTLVEMLKLKRRINIEIDPTLCALLTSLDIAEALKFMHKSKTLHGDLKPHNILLVSTPQGSDYKGFRAKISDFGLSQHMTKDQSYVVVSKGTEAYLPLEVFQQFALTEKSDVYAMGLLMWEIFYGIFWHAIYEEEKKRKGVKRAIDMGDYHPSCNSYCPKRFADIVHQCVRRDPSSRPTAADIVTALNECIAEHSSSPSTQPGVAAQRSSVPADARARSRTNGTR